MSLRQLLAVEIDDVLRNSAEGDCIRMRIRFDSLFVVLAHLGSRFCCISRGRRNGWRLSRLCWAVRTCKVCVLVMRPLHAFMRRWAPESLRQSSHCSFEFMQLQDKAHLQRLCSILHNTCDSGFVNISDVIRSIHVHDKTADDASALQCRRVLSRLF